MCIALCIVAHNIAQNRPDNFPSYPLDNRHCSDDDICLFEGREEYRTFVQRFIIMFRLTRVKGGSHSFACHPHVYPHMECAILPLLPRLPSSQPQSITTLWRVSISRPTEGRRLSWPTWLGEVVCPPADGYPYSIGRGGSGIELATLPTPLPGRTGSRMLCEYCFTVSDSECCSQIQPAGISNRGAGLFVNTSYGWCPLTSRRPILVVIGLLN